MDFTNSSLYTLSYVQGFNSDTIGSLNIGIATFNSSTLHSNIIKLKCTSSSKGNSWSNYVGQILQQVVLDNGDICTVDSKSIYLGIQLIELKAFSPCYLAFYPLKRIRQLTVSIHEFTG